MKKIGILVGSLRKDSYNRALAKTLIEIGGNDFNIEIIEIGKLPLYNQDMEERLPSEVVKFKMAVEDKDTIVFISPEFNRSPSGVIKNAVDWGSRPYGKNSFYGRGAAFAGVSPGAAGTAVAQSHLRSVMPMLGMRLAVQPEIYLTYKEGIFENPGTRDFLSGFLKTL